MEDQLHLHNSLSGEKELFKPILEGQVGMYVCGPTVYNDVHLGNCRSFVSFDVIFRYLKYLGYKVRYVRNITDVGHLLDDGEDRMAKGARLMKLEPMEVAQLYANRFHDMMRIFNVQNPSIEPHASGHIIEQIEMVKKIIDNGLGYEVNGSVYFDTLAYAKRTGAYGQLSGRKIEDLLTETRDLKKQDEKRHPSDFAIWIKADQGHIMRWPSPWSDGFPGWHLECSAMSTKYLGDNFDIHGGGNDLKFPHHENEIAQNWGACNCAPAKYWLHANMLLMNGRKMSKSDGNTISPQELFSGDSPHVSKGYSPMTVRFFMLQTHYRSTLDLTDEGLQAAEKGYKRLMNGLQQLDSLNGQNSGEPSALDTEIMELLEALPKEMNDDFNTPRTLARIFDIISKINSLKDGHIPTDQLSPSTLEKMKADLTVFVFDVFGLKDDTKSGEGDGGVTSGLMDLILDLRKSAREQKDWNTADKIRDALQSMNIVVKDGKEGTEWSLN
jgi:cysteinyl-tRNA synthetase